MATYNEKLRDPRWQRMRLKVMERDEWACQICYDSKSTLNVHHRFYDFGKDPWDYPIEALATLCEGCHEDETKRAPSAKRRLIRTLERVGFTAQEFEELADAFDNWEASTNRVGVEVDCGIIATAIASPAIRVDLEERHFRVLRTLREAGKLGPGVMSPRAVRDQIELPPGYN